MKIAVRGGHNPGVPGANGLLNEVTEDRKYCKSVIKYLQALGHEVLDVTPGNTFSSAQDLTYGVSKANEFKADLMVSCHVNAGGGQGCEVLFYNGSVKGKEYADKAVNAIANLGFHNRGAKADTRGLYELRHTNMPCIIIEPFFLDAQSDVDLYLHVGYDQLGKSIAESITGSKVPTEDPIKVADTPVIKPTPKPINNDVLKLQQVLNKLQVHDDKGNALVEDGIMGTRTGTAVKRFQNLMGLQVDGVVGSNTWGAINQILAKHYDAVETPHLEYASRYIQWRVGTQIDGIFGRNTQAAVSIWQDKNGLKNDGRVGNLTWTRLIG